MNISYRSCFLVFLRKIHSEVRVRFAPSPTGYLHLGGLRTALFNYVFAKKNGGKFVLRIEDTDKKRIVPGTVEHIQEMLVWTGLVPDEGPAVGGHYEPYIQSRRLHLYQEAVKLLIEKNAAYRCFCTKEELDSRKKSNKSFGYDNKCRNLSKEEICDKLSSNHPYVVRFKLKDKTVAFNDLVYGSVLINVSQSEGDPVLLKTDGYPTYHLANVVDDHYMKISHVLRGTEWLSSTPKHILLYDAFSWPAPYFAHLPVVLNSEGSKLSKRQNDVQVQYLKDNGYFPEAVVNYITFFGGGFRRQHLQEILTFQELVENFQLEGISVISSRMEKEKLETCNRQQLLNLLKDKNTTTNLVATMKQLVNKMYNEKKIAPSCYLTDEYIERILLYYTKERISRLPELLNPENIFLWVQPDFKASDFSQNKVNAGEILKQLVEKFQNLSECDITKDNVVPVLNNICEQFGVNNSYLLKLLRKVYSGQKEGPPVVDMISLLGLKQFLSRVRHVIQLLKPPEMSNKSAANIMQD